MVYNIFQLTHPQPTIHILKQKSYLALTQYRAGLWVPPDRSGLGPTDDRDAPGIITDVKIVSVKPSGSTSSTPPVTAAPSEEMAAWSTEVMLHPHLAEYLQSLQFNYIDQSLPTTFAQSNLCPLPQTQPQPMAQTIESLSVTNNPSHQGEVQTFTHTYQPTTLSFPDQLPEIDPNIMASFIPLSNFASADEFRPLDDFMVTQSVNEEWNRFMRQL